MWDAILELKQYLWAIFVAFMGWVWWSIKKRFVPREELDAVVRRVGALEVKISTLPTADDLRALREAMSETKTELRVFNERHHNSEQDKERFERWMDRMERYLMGERK